ncbi:MAG TPA: DUF3455 domain-containing protein [Bryobacteraceae bacterium]|nr:DUF3455 domain-containing protein [Bryobacteraceae bacterium]
MNLPIRRSVLRLMVLSAAATLQFAGAMQAQSGLAIPVPTDIQIEAGHQAFLKVGAVGTQNYICLPSGWTFTGPQATLFVTFQWFGTRIRQQVGTHYLTPNPDEPGALRPLWQSSTDTSIVWGRQTGTSSDPQFVDPTAIPWLRLEAVGKQAGPTGGAMLSQTTFIQRVNTTGGLKPTAACTVGERQFVPYTADYVFYRKSGT